MGWEAIQYVTSGLTLVAFVVAAIAWTSRTKLQERERLINSVPAERRADLVRDTLDSFNLKTETLTNDQRLTLALSESRERSHRFAVKAGLVGIAAILLAIVSIYAISVTRQDGPEAHKKPEIKVEPTKAVPMTAEREAAIAVCIEKRLGDLKRRDTFAQAGDVRCRGGGLTGDGESQSKVVTYQAPPGFQVVGNVKIVDVGRNGGTYGAVTYLQDKAEAVTKVSIPISCRSPNKIAGPGAWMSIRLEGWIEAVLTSDQRADAANVCRTTS